MIIRSIGNLRTFCNEAKRPFYVTTPIFYVNAAPHIGHLYSAVIADAICRYQRLRQPDTQVFLTTGTDENGIKVQQAAEKQGKPVAQYCSDISDRYKEVFKSAQISNTDYIRTTEQRHKQAVANFWCRLKERGHIYTSQYSGWYCIPDETFLTDSQLRLDQATGKRYSLESGHPVEWTEEQNYMFRLSAHQDDVLYWLKQGNRVRPHKFEKILHDMLSDPLPDVSISRPISRVQWAISVPGDNTQTVYVWLDALINYLTSAGYPDEKYKSQWPANVQVIGKDILKFHGIYWPAFLIAAGLEPPKQLFVHSHWTVNDEKMSKSKNNVIDPVEAAKVYTMEGLRYFLLREGVAHSDGNYSDTKALRILNAELADTLGNLLSRACAKSLNPQQIYPRPHATHLNDILLRLDAARHLVEAMQQLEARCTKHYDDNNFYLVVDAVMATLHATNNFFENARPWELKSSSKPKATTMTMTMTTTGTGTVTVTPAAANEIEENANRLETIIAMTMDALRVCGIVLQPIVPQLSGRLLDKLNVPVGQRLWRHLKYNFATDATAGKGISSSCSNINNINSSSNSNSKSNASDSISGEHYLQQQLHQQKEEYTQPRALRETDAILFRRILLQEEQSNTPDNASVATKGKQKKAKAAKVQREKKTTQSTISS